jgi:hypothetical protein
MKKTIFLFLLYLAGLQIQSQTVNQNDAEIEQIKKVIQTAYVEGLQNEGNFSKIEKGFHPKFALLIPGKGNEMEKFTLTEWKEKIKTDLASGKLPRKEEDRVSIKFLYVDITDNAAVAKFEFYVGSKLSFMDYQFLYKFEDGWKIVSKIYHKY